jgi:alpha-glucoside transport system permease protein
MRQGNIAPWLYLLPAMIILTVYVVYPTINTIGLSLQNKDSTASAAAACVEGQPCWGIFENYRYALTNEMDTSSVGAFVSSFFSSSFGNNAKWLVLMVSGTVGIGLLMAVLSDRVKYERVAKAIVFLPMAISFVGAGVIWGFVYDFNTGATQTGLLNAVVTNLGGDPVAFMSTQPINTMALIVVGVWIWSGFCMTIISAALKGVPAEVLEAARVDGASEWKVFWRVMLPMIAPTVVVVITTMVINVLKIFDIVYVMTGGNFGTEVIANRMYTEMYVNFNAGRGTAIAVVLIVLVIPFMYLNVRRFQEQEAIR